MEHSPPIDPLSLPIGCLREADAEADAEAEEEAEYKRDYFVICIRATATCAAAPFYKGRFRAIAAADRKRR